MTSQDEARRLARVRASIAGRFPAGPGSPIEVVGTARRAIVVYLKPYAASTAEELKAEFGSLVEITVGFKSFPERRLRVTGPRALEERGTLPDLRVTCKAQATTLQAGDAVTGKIVMRNTGPTDIEGSGSGSTGWLCRPGTLTPSGGYSGAIADAGHMFRITPGNSETLNFISGTASCEPSEEFVIQPGTYELVVPVEMQIGTDRIGVTILARNCFITVI